jgi:hypothetical protein
MSRLSPNNQRRPIPGTNVAIIKEGAPGGLKKFRCPTSHGIAVPVTRQDGTRVFRTPNGTEYVTRKF